MRLFKQFAHGKDLQRFGNSRLAVSKFEAMAPVAMD